jgi:hypothetical protein
MWLGSDPAYPKHFVNVADNRKLGSRCERKSGIAAAMLKLCSRALTMVWRLQGMWQYLRGDVRWRELKRTGLAAGAG